MTPGGVPSALCQHEPYYGRGAATTEERLMTPDPLIASAIFGLTMVELAALIAGTAYVVSLARAWRPLRSVRAENRELRELCDAASKKVGALEEQVKTLERATDLTLLQREHGQFADTMARVVDTLERLDGAVRASTTAVEALARDGILKRALEGER